MTDFTFEGHRVFYRREGAGDPIAFLPNATLTGKLWEHQAEHFAVAWEAPDEISHIIERFLVKHPQATSTAAYKSAAA
jgi:hypothetical protein